MDKIGYLGPRGTFTEQAAISYDKDGVLIAFPTIADVLQAIEAGEIEKGIVPIENSIEGAVNATLDMLIFDVNLYIRAEIVIPIEHHLLVKKNQMEEKISHILSHPQALGQCRKFLHQNYPMSELVTTSSTAEAVRQVSEASSVWGAIGTELSANIYGLEILHKGVQDQAHNETRFVVLGKQDGEAKSNCKTSLAFSTAQTNKPGELYRILDIFALWDINLTKIVSRPMKNRLGEYVFFIDLEGHREDEEMREALRMVQRKTSFFKVIGSYQIFT